MTLEDLFHDALALEGDAREAFLVASAAGHAPLVSEVRSLLAAHGGARSLLDESLPSLLGAPHRVGQRLGPHELVREIGSGGMGVVYLARRVDGVYEQEVAIKLIRGELLLGVTETERREIMRRFDAERRLLARLAHPHIARLLDAGSTPDGTPYLVMEYAAGEPIDRYCTRHELALAPRVALAIQVARAVQHAHAQLIAHRDLKPSNIFVAPPCEPREPRDGPSPKLLDFGIAKLLAASGEPDHDVTATIVQRLSPAYASPEQFRGEPVTAASDVYSLGVVFFELFTGHLPYAVNGLSPQNVARRVCDEPPQNPSACDRRVRGDLEVILLKALEKEAARRYGTAGELADDLERWLDQKPIRARRTSAAQRLAKLARRHKLSTALAVLFVLGAIGSSVTFQRLYEQARAMGGEADLERREAEEVASLFQSLFASPDPYLARGKDVRVVEVLDGSLARILDGLTGQPRVRAALEHIAGETYHGLGQYERAAALLADALTHYGTDQSAQLQRARGSLASVLLDMDQHDRAALLLEELLDQERRAGRERGATAGQALTSMGLVESNRGNYDRAIGLLTEGHQRLCDAVGADDDRTLDAELLLGQVLHESGARDQAEPRLAHVSAARAQQLGPEHPKSIEATSAYADLLANTDRGERAEALLRPLLETQRRLAGDRHKVTLTIEARLGLALRDQKKFAAAAEIQRSLLARQKEVLGVSHRDTLVTMSHLGLSLDDMDADEEAEALDRELWKLQEDALGENHPHVLITITNLAGVLRDRGNREAADDLFLEAIDRAEIAGIDAIRTRVCFAKILSEDRRFADAEAQLLEAEQEARREDHIDRLTLVLGQLVNLYHATGDQARARAREAEVRSLGAAQNKAGEALR